jgi:hypothetical protein
MLTLFLAAGFTFIGTGLYTWDYKFTVPIVSIALIIT